MTNVQFQFLLVSIILNVILIVAWWRARRNRNV